MEGFWIFHVDFVIYGDCEFSSSIKVRKSGNGVFYLFVCEM